MGILVDVTLSVIKHLKLRNVYMLKNCSCEKRLIGKLVLECEDEMLNRTDTLVDDNIEACEKDNCFIQTISLVIICLLLLVVVSTRCHYYYTRD